MRQIRPTDEADIEGNEQAITELKDGINLARTDVPSDLPPPSEEVYLRALNLSKKLEDSNIPTKMSSSGDLLLDMTGYQSSDDDALKAEIVARKILSEELEGSYDIGSLIGADENGNLWIYRSEEAKEAANRKASVSGLHALKNPAAMRSADALSDPGYHSDDGQSEASVELRKSDSRIRRDSDSAVGMSTPGSPDSKSDEPREPVKNYAKTLRLTSDQLRALNLKPGANSMSFTVNKASCQGFMYYWRQDVPIVISDIDGTITKYAKVIVSQIVRF